jgi:hypothetical protein
VLCDAYRLVPGSATITRFAAWQSMATAASSGMASDAPLLPSGRGGAGAEPVDDYQQARLWS